MIGRVLLALLVVLVACRCERAPPVAGNPTPDAPTPDAPTPDAGPDASYSDLGQLDPAFLDGVTVAKGGIVDATDLGPIVDVRVIERVTGENTGLPVIEILLVVSGRRTIAVDIGHTWDYLEETIPTGALIVVAEDDAPRPWSADEDGDTKRLPSRAPMLYKFSTESPHLVDTFVVVREKDALLAFTFFIDDGESADAWEKQATVKLPRGATLRFP